MTRFRNVEILAGFDIVVHGNDSAQAYIFSLVESLALREIVLKTTFGGLI